MIFIYTVGYIFPHGCNLGLVPLSKYRPPGILKSAPFLLKMHQLCILPPHPYERADVNYYRNQAAISPHCLLCLIKSKRKPRFKLKAPVCRIGKFVILVTPSGSTKKRHCGREELTPQLTQKHRRMGWKQHTDYTHFYLDCPMTLQIKTQGVRINWKIIRSNKYSAHSGFKLLLYVQSVCIDEDKDEDNTAFPTCVNKY